MTETHKQQQQTFQQLNNLQIIVTKVQVITIPSLAEDKNSLQCIQGSHSFAYKKSDDFPGPSKGGFHQHRSNRRFTELQLFLTAS